MTDEKSDASFGVEETETPLQERTTQPPPPPGTVKVTPEELMEIVGERLSSIEIHLASIDHELVIVKTDVREIHGLLLGIQIPNVTSISSKDGRLGGLGLAFHDLNDHLTSIKANTEMMLEKHTEYVNDVARVHQENVRLKFEIERLKILAAMHFTESGGILSEKEE